MINLFASSYLLQVAVGFIKEVGSLLQDLSPQGLHSMYPTDPID
jgi:hypothetical protein